MISFEQAQEEILKRARPVGTVEKPLTALLGNVLAEAAVARYDMPVFSNSAMDGFGVLAQDVAQASHEEPVKLKVMSVVQAGDDSGEKVQQGHAVKIFTGARIPDGVTAVVMREYCEEDNGHVLVGRPVTDLENIRGQGEEFTAGTAVVEHGTRVTPAVVGMVANLGYDRMPVYKAPRVSLVITGNELIEPGAELEPGKIYDSNSYALLAALEELGIDDVGVHRVADDKEETRRVFQTALDSADVVITVGGVSVGDYDFVKDVVEEEGVHTVFWRIAMKPGKPVYFGEQISEMGNKLVLGLPGNPVSALVTFYLLVKPALQRMQGVDTDGSEGRITAELMAPLKKKAGRLDFVRGRMEHVNGRLQVNPTQGQGSHMLGGLAAANCLICFPAEATELNAGERVDVQVLD